LITINENALLAAQITPLPSSDNRIRYIAMVSVSKGKNERGADWGESFDTPQEALAWLRERLPVSLFESIAPPR
jgi:hypothetical protein